MEQTGTAAPDDTLRASGRPAWAGAAELAPGTMVGRYIVLGLIARGGMGEVYAAYHPDLDRRIALKVVYGERGAEPDGQKRLLREAQIIARLNHPNIVTVHDAGIVGERVYLAMEFVDGDTISAWLRDTQRPWPEVLEVFLAAARGLAAAHAAKVVHRDFKPQNVMIGRDGRVRVMDFGLARPMRDPAETAIGPTGGSPASSVASTTVGALIGTPAYMAPEQLRGGPADARTDQFSFCIALHEGVYGARPGVATEAAAPRARVVPPWLKRIVRRGVDPDRQKRFGSMDELIRCLEEGRNRPVRRGLFFAAASLLLVAAIVAGRSSKPHQFACTPPADRLDAVWAADELPGSRRAAIHRVFSASGLADAETTWTRVAAALDDRMRRWRSMYQEACEATHVRGEQSAEVLDLRMTCLAANLDETRAYGHALLGARPDALGQAIATATALGPVQQCADVPNLRLQVPLPTNPPTRAEVLRLQQVVRNVDVLLGLRYVKQAETELNEALPAVKALSYKPLLAQILQRVGLAQTLMYQLRPAGQTVQEALVVAEAARDDLSAAVAADVLAYIAAQTGKYPEARTWLRLGEAALERAHGQDSLPAAWIQNEWGNVFYEEGDFSSSERANRKAIALKARLLGPDHPDVAASFNNLANTLQELGRWDEALAALESSIATFERHGDTRSLAFASVLSTKGEILTHLGRLDDADAALDRALGIESGGREDERLLESVTLTDLGEIFIARQRPREAIPLLRRAQSIQTSDGEPNAVRLAVTQLALARALVASGGSLVSVTDSIADACAGFERNRHTRRQRELLAWFSGLPKRARLPAPTACADLRPPARARVNFPTSTRASAG